MPKRIDPKCLACAQLSAAEAQVRHGPEGDGCWVASRCRRRRSHYRHRVTVNTQRRERYRRAIAGAETPVESLVMDVALPPVAYLYLYRVKRRDAPIHGISAAVWRGQVKLLQVEPFHCAGLRGHEVKRAVAKMLSQIQERFPTITRFEAEVRLEPQECPLDPCPLKGAAAIAVTEEEG
ncbi:hypothetical protein [Leptolyngbya sp. PCC 6406]|uniref:hypothetical protein n=1 Tax=Leptolyngbya sp. PCC 6406 TaxID=1173264 RepID=UPI0002ABDB22|nr:hypothetical protein [Leptolyngbya sp. PCC 6406]